MHYSQQSSAPEWFQSDKTKIYESATMGSSPFNEWYEFVAFIAAVEEEAPNVITDREGDKWTQIEIGVKGHEEFFVYEIKKMNIKITASGRSVVVPDQSSESYSLAAKLLGFNRGYKEDPSLSFFDAAEQAGCENQYRATQEPTSDPLTQPKSSTDH